MSALAPETIRLTDHDYVLHVFEPEECGNLWRVWLDSNEGAKYDGLCIGIGESRDIALNDAKDFFSSISQTDCEVMNEADLRRLFPNASASTIRANQVAGDESRSHRGVQKSKASDPGPKQRQNANDDRRKDAGADGRNHPRYRIGITLKYSDARRRDLDGAAATVLDCLITAIGRLKAMDF